jgi:hypothetical protein
LVSESSGYWAARESNWAIEQWHKTVEIDSVILRLTSTCRVNTCERASTIFGWKNGKRRQHDTEYLRLVKEAKYEYAKSGFRAAVKRLVALRQEQAKRIT